MPAGLNQAKSRFDAAYLAVQAEVEVNRSGAARDHVAKLCRDISRSLGNWQAYRLSDLEAWSVAQERAIEGFQKRMTTMIEAAVDRGGVEGLANRLVAQGLDEVEVQEFAPAHHSRSAGWILRGYRD